MRVIKKRLKGTRVSGHVILIDRREPGVGVVELRGEHDEFTAPKLAREIRTLLEQGLNAVVDLRGTTFLGAANVGVLLSAYTDAAERGRRLVLVIDASTGPAVRTLFELTGLEALFPVHPTRQRALAAIRVEGERRSGLDRRSGADRRSGWGRAPVFERRSGAERRSGFDRRSCPT